MGPLDEAARTPVSPSHSPLHDACTATLAVAERDDAAPSGVQVADAADSDPSRRSKTQRALFAIDTPVPPVGEALPISHSIDAMGLPASAAEWRSAAWLASAAEATRLNVYTWPAAPDSLSFASPSSSEFGGRAAEEAEYEEQSARYSFSDEDDDGEPEESPRRSGVAETKGEVAAEALSVSKLFSFVRKIVDGSGTPRPRKPVFPQSEKLADRNDAELTECS
jgi:hypothetical protein